MSEQQDKRYPAAVFQPDEFTDYVYLNVTRDEAIARFKQNEDWERVHEPAGYQPDPQMVENDNFILWRNRGEDMARQAEREGLPPLVAMLLRGK